MKTKIFIKTSESRMAVERERERESNSLLTKKVHGMLNKILFCCLFITSFVYAQIPVGTDAQHPTQILLNTDSVYSQNRSYGWFIFNTHNVSGISGNVINLKAAFLPTNSRIIMYDTVMIRIVNLYDSTLNLIASDTLHSGDTAMIFTASVNVNQWYYLQTIANYPCDTCVYNEAVSFEMKLTPFSTFAFTCTQPACILTAQQTPFPNVQTISCELVCNGNMNNVSTNVSTLSINSNTTSNIIPGVTGWTTPTPHTPDYFNAWATPTVGVPCNVFGNQNSAPSIAPGDGYLGIIWGYYLPNSSLDYTEYIQAPLLSPLVAGKNYVVSFLVSRADYAPYLIPALSVYFSKNIICEPSPNPIGIISSTNIAAYTCTNTSILNDPNNWQFISFCYTATGGEKFITIGRPNFPPYSSTQYNIGTTSPSNFCPSPSPFPNISYYAYLFIDNVSVRPLDVTITTNTNNCSLVGNTGLCLDTSYDNSNLLGSNVSYQWSPSAGLSSPNSSVTSIISGGSSAYTLTVTYSGANGICSAMTTISNVNIFSNPSITVSDPILCTGYTATLTATGANSYTWLPSNTNGSVIVVSPSVTSVYTVIATNSNMCVGTSTAEVYVDNNCCISGTISPVLYNCTLVPYGSPGAILWPPAPGMHLNQIISAPISGVITGTYSINGNLLINAPLTFSLCELTMGEASQMIQNQPVSIFNSYIHGCNKMWKGILSNHKLNILHSFIEDAQTAIQTTNPNHPSISLNDVLFNKNYSSVSIGNTINASSQNNFRITNCIFTSRQIPSPTPAQLSSTTLWRNMSTYNLSALNAAPTALLLGSSVLGIPNTIRAQNGITCQNARFTNNTALTIGQWTSNQTQINILDNLGNYGIVGVWGSKLNIQDNYFNNFLAGADVTGAMRKAVGVLLGSDVAVGYAPSSVFSAMTNTFVNCLTGVFATGNSSISITNNRFVSNSIAVEIQGMNQTSGQINTVNNNTFQNCNYDVKSTNNNAIQLMVLYNISTYTVPPFYKFVPVYNVYAAEPSITALVGYTVSGNDFRGKRASGVFFQNISNSFITTNYIEMVPSLGSTNYVSNIALENTQQLSVSDNTLSCNPTSTSSWNNFGILNTFGQNNEFCNNTINKVGICMKHQGTSPSIITNNTFNNNLSDKALIGIWLANNGFVGDIEYNTANIQHAPAGNIFGNKPTKFSTQYDFQIADTYVSHNSTGSNIYVNPFPAFNNLYMPLVNVIDVSGGTCASPNICFPFNVQTSTYPNQLATCTNYPNLQRISPGIPAFVANPSAIQPLPNPRRVAEKSVFEFIRKNNITLPNAANFINNQLSSNHGRFVRTDSLSEKYVQSKNPAVLNQAKSINNTIVPAYPSEITQKNFNEVYFVFLENDSLITSVHIDSLRSIAGKCPYTEGTAVYQARALLSRYDTTQYYNGCEITMPNTTSSRLIAQENNLQKDEDAFPVMVYPNPAKEFITVWAPKGSEIRITDISGKTLIESELKEGTSKIISVKELSDGLYLYSIRKDEKVLKTDKLILIK